MFDRKPLGIGQVAPTSDGLGLISTGQTPYPPRLCRASALAPLAFSPLPDTPAGTTPIGAKAKPARRNSVLLITSTCRSHIMNSSC